MKRSFAVLFILAAAALCAQSPAKFAVVIGNGNYTNFGALKNPVNDANDMAAALQDLGFTVEKVLNGNLSQMENAAIRLKERLTGAGRNAYGFFYYAGHGVQVEGQNYLIPANANIPAREFLRDRTLSAQIVLDILNGAKNALNIVVLDACRDFPTEWSRSLGRGLAVMHPPTDSIIMYATAAGDIADDGGGDNGFFTGHLLTHLGTPGLEVNEVFRRTMRDVRRASNDRQRPALYTDFAEIAYLGTRPAPVATPPAPAVTAAPANRPTMQSAPAQAPANRPTMQAVATVQPARVTPAAPPSIRYTTKLPEMKHSNSVSSLALSPDGKYIASGSTDKTIKLWDAATGREIRSFVGHSGNVTSVMFSPDGRYIASGSASPATAFGSEAESVRIWDVTTGREIRRLVGHSRYDWKVAWSPDGKYIAAGTYDKSLTLWDVATGREVRSVARHTGSMWTMAFSPDGRFLASGSWDGPITLWDSATGREIRNFVGHSDNVTSVAFSLDGRFLASGSWDDTIKLWDAATGREIRNFTGHSHDVSSVAFSPDGKYIASGSRDKTIKLWDTATGREIRTLSGHSAIVDTVAFSPDGKYIVSGGDQTVRIWDVATGEQK